MSGINFNDLPSNLQQKLQPYRFVAKSVDDAIAMAKQAGKWSASDDKVYNSLNGGKAWGVFDGFEKSEVQQFKKDVAEAAKKDPVNSMSIAAKKGIARDVAENPTKYTPKRFDMESGRYVVYQKDQNTGKDTYTYYDQTGKKMSENAFKQAEGLTTLAYDSKSGKLKAGKTNDNEGKSWSDYSTGEKLLAVALAPLTLLTSCDEDHETVMNFEFKPETTINITFDTASLTAAMQETNAILAKIENHTYTTAQELQELKDRLAEINENILTLIANQEQYAKSADEYFQQILDVSKGNQQLIKFIVDQLAEGNDTLKQIKALMETNNASLEDILEAVTKCKYGIDVLHEDNNDIKKLINTVSALITKLPSELKAKFGDYFNNIIKGISDNGNKLDALYNLLAIVNKNVQAGNTAILNKMEKMQAILEEMFRKFGQFDAKITNMLNAIATAIGNMGTKGVDLNKIEETLNAILNKIGNNKAEMEQITKLLQAINANTVINGQTQIEILDAIKKLDGNMTAQFTKLIEIGNRNNKLQGDTNNLVNEVLKAIKNFNVQPGSQTEIDLTALLNTINANGADLSSKLSDIYGILKTLNANVIKNNNDNLTFFTKILAAMPKNIDRPDFSQILAKLDEILAAIKNHTVDLKITVDGHFTICDKDGNVVHEGEMDNLDWILG